MRQDLVDGIVDYFTSDHWENFLNYHVDHPEDDIWHSHAYVENSIHPESLEPIMEAYFEAQGRPLVRKIDFLTPLGTTYGSLHGVHPEGLPHFDWFFRYNPDAILQPARDEWGEEGQNALSWGREYMVDFYQGFDFKPVGPTEEAAIREYFGSRHWKQYMNLVLDDDVIHVHANVRINFDPKVLELLAREELAKQGWTIDKVVPNVYNVDGTYTGKHVFLGRRPELVYDIGWKYDPDVVIERADEPWMRDDCPDGFDWCLTSEFDALIERDDYTRLEDDEIAAVIDQFDARVEAPPSAV